MTLPFQVVTYHPSNSLCNWMSTWNPHGFSQVHDCHGWSQLGESHCTSGGHLVDLVFILPILRVEPSFYTSAKRENSHHLWDVFPIRTDRKANSTWVERHVLVYFNPKKLCSKGQAISGGLNVMSFSNPEKLSSKRSHQWGVEPHVLVQPQKAVFKGASHQWGVEPHVVVQPQKAVFKGESHQWGVEPHVLVQPQKAVFKGASHQWGVEPHVFFQPRKECVQRGKPSVRG